MRNQHVQKAGMKAFLQFISFFPGENLVFFLTGRLNLVIFWAASVLCTFRIRLIFPFMGNFCEWIWYLCSVCLHVWIIGIIEISTFGGRCFGTSCPPPPQALRHLCQTAARIVRKIFLLHLKNIGQLLKVQAAKTTNLTNMLTHVWKPVWWFAHLQLMH